MAVRPPALDDMGQYSFWIAVTAWLGDHSPPLIAGFIGGVLGSIAQARFVRRRKKEG